MAKKDFFTIKNEGNETAVIDITGVIGFDWWEDEADKNNSFNRLQASLNEIKALKVRTIRVNIFSYGGSVHHALAIHDTLKEHSASITTNIIGLCASAATVIAMAGEKRIMSDNSLFLIHKCMGWAYGNENDLQAELDSHKMYNQRLTNIYEKVGVKAEDVNRLMNESNGQGIWITATEAKEYGFINEISQTAKKVASVSADIFAKTKLPKLPSNYDFLIENNHPTPDGITAVIAGLTRNLVQEIKQLFTIDDSPFTQNTNNQINNTMKNTFPTIAALFAFGDDVQFDKEKGVTLNEEQLKNLESELAKITALQTEKTALQGEKTSLEAQISEKDTKITALQAIVNKVPVPVKKPNGNDADDNAEPSFEDTMRNDTYYQSVSAEYGLKL